jgi:hypothetical protein
MHAYSWGKSLYMLLICSVLTWSPGHLVTWSPAHLLSCSFAHAHLFPTRDTKSQIPDTWHFGTDQDPGIRTSDYRIRNTDYNGLLLQQLISWQIGVRVWGSQSIHPVSCPTNYSFTVHMKQRRLSNFVSQFLRGITRKYNTSKPYT